MVSHEFKCIFIHIPKTAGTSIEKKLGLFETLQRGSQDHRTIQEVKTSLPNEQFHAYFKFAFVRNPWARAFSWYRNLMRDSKHRHSSLIPVHCTFTEFIKYRLNDISLLRPQLDWITDETGTILVDFVGRFEFLEEDFTKICQKLNLPNQELPELLRTPTCNYAPMYNQETREIVAARYREEIDRFTYRFEDPFYEGAAGKGVVPFEEARKGSAVLWRTWVILCGIIWRGGRFVKRVFQKLWPSR